MEAYIRFKDGISPDEWNYLHPKIHKMFEVLVIIFDQLGFDLEITSLLRKKNLDSGVHETGRALDCVPRQRKYSKLTLSRYDHNKIEAFMCFMFRRPGPYKSCMYHDAGTGFHYHLQCEWTDDWSDLKGIIPIKSDPTSEPSVE